MPLSVGLDRLQLLREFVRVLVLQREVDQPIVFVQLIDGLENQRTLDFASDRQVLDVTDQRFEFFAAQQVECRHGAAGIAAAEVAHEIVMGGRRERTRRGFVFENAPAEVARIGFQEPSRRPRAVAGQAVAVGAVFAVQPQLASRLVAADRAGGKTQLFQWQRETDVQSRQVRDQRRIGRAEEKFQHADDVLPLLVR